MSKAPTPEDTGTISREVRNYTLFILTIMYTFNFIDRQILVILQPLIKADLNLSDTQLGLMSGIVFALFYTILGIPIARLADKKNRRNIIAISLTIWSGMTAISGLAQNYTQMLLARLGVGVGEAGGSPPAHSMISDLFDEKRRATALAIYSAGLYLGVLLGFSLGGYLGHEYGWRKTFFIVGIPGILLAIILWRTVPEPVRGRFDKQGTAKTEQPSLLDTMAYILGKKSFLYLALGSAVAAFTAYGLTNFLPSYLIRYRNIPLTDIGFILAIMLGSGGMIGSFLSGYATDKLGRKDPRWYLWFPAVMLFISVPLLIGSFLAPTIETMFMLGLLGSISNSCYLAPTIAVSHRLVSAKMRATVSALLFFILNLIGLGLGPLFIGGLSDALTASRGTESLHIALIIGILVTLVAVLLYWKGGQKLAIDLKNAESENS